MLSNETVAEICEDVSEYLTSIGPSEYPSEAQFEEFANRFEAAHKRAMAEKDAEIAELQRTLDLHDLYADEECEDADTARIVAEGEADAKDADIAELRKCLKEAISASRIDCGICNRDCKMKMSFADRTIHNCERIIQWRKALEGANNG